MNCLEPCGFKVSVILGEWTIASEILEVTAPGYLKSECSGSEGEGGGNVVNIISDTKGDLMLACSGSELTDLKSIGTGSEVTGYLEQNRPESNPKGAFVVTPFIQEDIFLSSAANLVSSVTCT